MGLESLSVELSVLCEEAHAINQRIAEKEKQIAEIVAEQAGVKIGTIVYTEQVEGFSQKKTKLVRRYYRVNRIRYKNYGNRITIFGTLIRKDGTDGECREIWQKYTIEGAEAK